MKHSTGKPCQNMADELDFGSPATSARTSNDDFTPTTLTGFADTSLDHTGDTLGGMADAVKIAMLADGCGMMRASPECDMCTTFN